jgi:DNA-binding response OmpR family regulator
MIILKKRIKEEIEVLKFESIKLNISIRTCFLDDEKIDIDKKEFELIEYFIENQGLIFSREKILDHIWGDEIDVFYRAEET